MNCRVTAFTLRSLHSAMASEWTEQVYIDVELLNSLATWIHNQQDRVQTSPTYGAFIHRNEVIYDRNMNVCVNTSLIAFIELSVL